MRSGPPPDSLTSAAKPVLPITDADSAVWRTVTGLLAWVGVAYGACSVGEFLIDVVRGGPIIGTFATIRSITKAKDLVELLVGVHAIAALALAVVLLVGSAGTLARRRWGPPLMTAFAIGMAPTALIYLAWIGLSLRSYPQQTTWSFWMTVMMFALEAVRSWSFPAVVFFTLRAYRKHLAGDAPGAAFEPLPPASVRP